MEGGSKVDLTGLLNGFAGGNLDGNAVNALAGLCSGGQGNNNGFLLLFLIILLFWGGNGNSCGNGCGTNNGCGGWGQNCGGYNNGGCGCGSGCYVNPCGQYYTYFDPCCNKSSKDKDCTMYCVQPVANCCGSYQNCNNNCGSGGNIIWLILILFLIGGRGWGGNPVPVPKAAAVGASAESNNRCEGEVIDFTD